MKHPDENKFPVVKKQKRAKGTSDMPNSVEAAKNISDAINKASEYDSGAFMDARSL